MRCNVLGDPAGETYASCAGEEEAGEAKASCGDVYGGPQDGSVGPFKVTSQEDFRSSGGCLVMKL